MANTFNPLIRHGFDEVGEQPVIPVIDAKYLSKYIVGIRGHGVDTTVSAEGRIAVSSPLTYLGNIANQLAVHEEAKDKIRINHKESSMVLALGTVHITCRFELLRDMENFDGFSAIKFTTNATLGSSWPLLEITPLSVFGIDASRCPSYVPEAYIIRSNPPNIHNAVIYLRNYKTTRGGTEDAPTCATSLLDVVPAGEYIIYGACTKPLF